jgi:mono/diheme cytochrome c family protein
LYFRLNNKTGDEMPMPTKRGSRTYVLLALLIPTLAFSAGATKDPRHAAGKATNGQYIERGRYLVRIGGCNDCHTPGYPESGGNIPEKEWLTGNQVGWRGPWGTTYPPNLRLTMNEINEEQWIKAARTKQLRPPMPWFALRDMSDEDLRAVHRFIRHLGPAGGHAPAYVPPDQTPAGPFIQFPMPPG